MLAILMMMNVNLVAAKMKVRKDGTSPYYTNKSVRKKINKLLHENSMIWSNLGTGTNLDFKSRKEGEKQWGRIAKKIKELDQSFFKIVCLLY
jgi:hypothetical protein